MSDWSLLGLTAVGLYLVECLRWVRADDVLCLRVPGLQGWRARRGSSFLGTDRGGFALLNPAVLSGSLVVTHTWPLSLGPEGLTALTPDALARGDADPGLVRFDARPTLTTDDASIQLNGKPWVTTASVQEARRWHARMLRLMALPESDRADAIRQWVRETVDTQAAHDRWQTTRIAIDTVVPWCSLLAAEIFVAAPVVIALFGPHPSWMWLLGVVLATTLMTVRAYVRVHGQLWSDARAERWTQAGSMLLLPLAAIRGADLLTRDALRAYAWPVVLPLVCGEEEAARLLRPLWFDLTRGGDAGVTGAGSGATCARWFTSCVRDEYAAALGRLRVPLDTAPVRQAGSTAYCPRCHAQFQRDLPADCTDCAGVPLRSWAALMPLPPLPGSHP